MGLTTRPSKTIDLSKIDDIQEEYFAESENTAPQKITAGANKNQFSTNQKPSAKSQSKRKIIKDFAEAASETAGKSANPEQNQSKTEVVPVTAPASATDSIADLLAIEQFDGVRHTSRPFTVPRSLTIDLSRLKSKFRTRNIQYTQNELIDKMLRESLQTVTAENYHELREKALKFVKSPEQSSRRSVTLTEQTVHEMAELKADLAQMHARRFSSDEIFSTLLAVAFLPLYEQKLLP